MKKKTIEKNISQNSLTVSVKTQQNLIKRIQCTQF